MESEINTEGITQVGEITTRVQKEFLGEPDHHNARVAAAVGMLQELQLFAAGLVERAGPYDDMRAVETILAWARDKVQQVQTPSYDGES